ncbi:MAG TPA: hypothetical protein VMH84_19265 [Xanthobacteraceae bacterium]|nr:hypothetical protein [Xanthobacteraceae bacterium]
MRMIWDYFNGFLTGLDQSVRWIFFKISGVYLPPNCPGCRIGYLVGCTILVGLILGFMVRPKRG